MIAYVLFLIYASVWLPIYHRTHEDMVSKQVQNTKLEIYFCSRRLPNVVIKLGQTGVYNKYDKIINNVVLLYDIQSLIINRSSG